MLLSGELEQFELGLQGHADINATKCCVGGVLNE